MQSQGLLGRLNGLTAELSGRVRAVAGGGKLSKALAWSTFAHVAGQGIRIIGQLVLARLLAPSMFGIMGIASVIQMVLALLTDIGLRVTVIQSPRGDDPAFLNTVWTVQILRGALIWGINLAISAGLFFGQTFGMLPTGSTWAAPELPLVLAVASMSSLISSFQSTKVLTVSRSLDLGRATMIELLSQTIGLAAIIALGLLTGSIWSLVAGWLVSAAIGTVLSHIWLHGPGNAIAWDRSALKELYHFGGMVLASSLFFVFATNADRLLFAGFVGPTQMGFYSIAIGLVGIVDGIGSRILQNVALANFSDVARADPSALRKAIYRLRLPLDAIALLASGFLFAAAPSIVHTLYDHRYQEAGVYLKILALSLFFFRFNIFTTVYLAINKPQWPVLLNAFKLLSLLIILPLSFHFGGFDAAVYGVALHGALLLPIMYWLNRKQDLNDLRFEAKVLGFWVAGWAAGLAAAAVLGYLNGAA
jgi:O-antigen/teichoic acid export membrane protein